MQKLPRWSNYLILGFGIIFVSTAAIFIRLAQSEVSIFVISAYRLTIATLILGCIILIRKQTNFANLGKKGVTLALAAGVFLAVHFLTWITSLKYTSVASSVVLVTTTPIWVSLLSPLILKEKLHKLAILGLILAFAGSIVVALSEVCVFEGFALRCETFTPAFSSSSMLGNMLALVGALMAAGYMLVGRILRKRVNTLTYTLIVYGIAALIVDVLVLLRREQVWYFSGSSYMWLIALGVIPQLFGHSIFNWSLEILPASIVSIALLGEPIGSTLLAYLFLSETPTIFEIVGGLVILAGIVLAYFPRKKVNAT